MDGTNADSDNSMTWEDFFGSTTDLTPTLIGIYDSLLEPAKSLRPEVNGFITAKDARNDPPVIETNLEDMTEKSKENPEVEGAKDPTKLPGGVKLPVVSINKSSLYSSMRTKSVNGASETKSDFATSDSVIVKESQIKTIHNVKQSEANFGNLSPNVKRMISSATETTTLKFQKKTANVVRSSGRYKTNIPLVGATSKISQSHILPSVEIYAQPSSKQVNKKVDIVVPSKIGKPDFILNEVQTTYDVPTNNRPMIYDVPNSNNKTAFESLSLPYIDQSIELSISSNDREFDTKLSSKENSPQKPSISPKESPAKIEKVDATNRNDLPSDSPVKKLAKTQPYPEAIGSTGNLKSGTLEKEVQIINPPTVEVSRPLSMSSIASSSSTSSSGVQNKGGVNSAYLASIESLDDHSDADLTSANGSNNFVNGARILNSSVSEDKSLDNLPREHMEELSGLTQLERVLTEIVQTENVYVEDLRQVVEGYLHVWRNENTFSSEELSELFNNIEDIYVFNRSLCEELNGCSLDAVCIARCFVSNTAGFAVYASYCTGYPKTMERLAELASKVQSAREFRERQIALGHPLPLASYLLKPVQRILKYHLLLQNVVKHSSTEETQYALLQMTAIAQHIDDMKRIHEHAVRVQEIQSLLYGWNGPDLTTYGELCAEGTFRVWGAKALRHVFLFDNMLLVTKNRDDSVLAYKSHIMCNNMMLVESISGAALSFHVIPWDAPREQLTLQARNTAHKRQWTLLLKRVILENYNAVIPSHARQLVMELGQNKTDDDMLAEKSHNLISQASMRKQLSAPEYLEKRKLERERRKAFETSIRGRMKKINRNHTIPNSRSQDCDCSQVSAEKGTDYTCDVCYIDICSDCENETVKAKYQCDCNNKEVIDKCPDCDKSLQFIDGGSAENLERRNACKCSDFKSSQESFSKDVGNLNKTRGYHSSDNIVGYTDTKSKEDLNETNNSLINVRNIHKTCLKCCKIKENIAIDSTNTLRSRKSRLNDLDRQKADTLRSKSKDDPQRTKLSKISSWRRKSEPGLQQNNIGILTRKPQDSDSDKNDSRGSEKIEFECRNCGSNKISRKVRNNEGIVISDPELEKRGFKSSIEIKMYNAKNVPKKISKLKKNRAKGLRLGSDTTAKFYADLSSDVSTENILHISESNDSLNVDKPKETKQQLSVPGTLPKDEDIDEETYKKLIEKTDSFKKNELEKVMYLNQQKVINEGSEIEEKIDDGKVPTENVPESGEETEQPLEQIISQLLMQNREFQKLIKKQQLRNSSQKRHQRLLKSHSNPEQVIAARNGDLTKIKPKFVRQSSENLGIVINKNIEVDLLSPPNETNEPNDQDEDHIYETLRVENKTEESKAKPISRIVRPKRLPSPPNPTQDKVNKTSPVESDYVYLSFDQLNKIQDSEGIYEVPVKSPEKVRKEVKPSNYYVAMANIDQPDKNSEENLYDNLIDVRRRKKEDTNVVSSDYLPMNADQSPNTPEIWLSRQKEHFNVSRDRKSGSLPRSFQVVTSNQEDSSLSSFKLKPNNNSKTYLNRDGKVMSTDRPFTIASDQSEISYDDVENYMSDGDILKFNNKKVSSETGYVQDISQSTLDLEEEIDRCYKNNFEKVKISSDDNENHLTMSQTNLNISMTSSCEGLPLEENTIKEVIHPEHKIYKPNSNMLSLKNVLSRFKNKAPNKSTEENDVNANDPSSPDSGKSDLKSPTGEKRSGLNPRSYSKNLLQRFRSIIGDEPQDNNQNREVIKGKDESQIKTVKNDIKVVITSSDTSPTASTITYATNADALSRSVCEHTTLTESQNEKNNLDTVSQSCENITQKSEHDRPLYDKSVSMVSSVSSNASITSSPIKSSLHQSFKIPMYMQGSKHLGARIAQSDYVDPATLKSSSKSVNVLINKNSVRPDSLFSNSSFVTLSSEGVYLESQTKSNNTNDQNDGKKNKVNTSDVESHDNDESFYEKSFEKIEQATDEYVFRDSAVYSDQEDTDDNKPNINDNVTNKNVPKVEQIKKNSSFRAQKVTVTTNEKSTLHSRMSISSNVTQKVNKLNIMDPKTESESKVIRTKEAPPIPVKPKTTNIPSAQSIQHKVFIPRNNNLIKNQEQSSSSESVNVKTIKRNTNYKPNIKTESQLTTAVKTTNNDVITTKNTMKDEIDNASKIKQPHNQLLKRATFERASLDSATRKLKTINTNNEIKRSSVEPPKTTKTVLERRMEIEQMSKTEKSSNSSNSSVKKSQIAKPVSITTKVATFERSISEKSESERPTATEKNIINRREKSFIDQVKTENTTDDPKGSWVKQVVNKFQ